MWRRRHPHGGCFILAAAEAASLHLGFFDGGAAIDLVVVTETGAAEDRLVEHGVAIARVVSCR